MKPTPVHNPSASMTRQLHSFVMSALAAVAVVVGFVLSLHTF